MAEWLKAHDWKSCGHLPAWVRIPPRPCNDSKRTGWGSNLFEPKAVAPPGANAGDGRQANPTPSVQCQQPKRARGSNLFEPKAVAPPGANAGDGRQANPTPSVQCQQPKRARGSNLFEPKAVAPPGANAGDGRQANPTPSVQCQQPKRARGSNLFEPKAVAPPGANAGDGRQANPTPSVQYQQSKRARGSNLFEPETAAGQSHSLGSLELGRLRGRRSGFGRTWMARHPRTRCAAAARPSRSGTCPSDSSTALPHLTSTSSTSNA